MSSRSTQHKPGASFSDVKKRERELKKIIKSGGKLAGLQFQKTLQRICTSPPDHHPVNWMIRNGKLKEWQTTGTFHKITGLEKHIPVTHVISWWFFDRLGTIHVGTSSKHFQLLWKHQYTPPQGTSFATQSKEEIESMISTICRSALQSGESSYSSESKDYSVPQFLPSMTYIKKLVVEIPEQWKLYYCSTKRETSLLGAETVNFTWYYKHYGRLYVGNINRCFQLRKSKRSSYVDATGKRVALQNDTAVNVVLAALNRAV